MNKTENRRYDETMSRTIISLRGLISRLPADRSKPTGGFKFPAEEPEAGFEESITRAPRRPQRLRRLRGIYYRRATNDAILRRDPGRDPDELYPRGGGGRNSPIRKGRGIPVAVRFSRWSMHQRRRWLRNDRGIVANDVSSPSINWVGRRKRRVGSPRSFLTARPFFFFFFFSTSGGNFREEKV